MRKETKNWLERRLLELPGKTQAGLARHLNVPESRTTELKHGDWTPKPKLISKAAQYLEWTTDQFLKVLTRQHDAVDYEISYHNVTIKGEVAAGAWKESIGWPADEWKVMEITGQPSPFDGLPRFGVQVVGESMNQKFPHGTILECVTFIDMGRDPVDGEYVIVHRRNGHGLYECTVKRYHESANGQKWLMPESSEPEFQSSVAVNETGEDDEVIIYARIIRSTSNH